MLEILGRREEGNRCTSSQGLPQPLLSKQVATLNIWSKQGYSCVPRAFFFVACYQKRFWCEYKCSFCAEGNGTFFQQKYNVGVYMWTR